MREIIYLALSYLVEKCCTSGAGLCGFAEHFRPVLNAHCHLWGIATFNGEIECSASTSSSYAPYNWRAAEL